MSKPMLPQATADLQLPILALPNIVYYHNYTDERGTWEFKCLPFSSTMELFYYLSPQNGESWYRNFPERSILTEQLALERLGEENWKLAYEQARKRLAEYLASYRQQLEAELSRIEAALARYALSVEAEHILTKLKSDPSAIPQIECHDTDNRVLWSVAWRYDPLANAYFVRIINEGDNPLTVEWYRLKDEFELLQSVSSTVGYRNSIETKSKQEITNE
jgi:hypothetical protein